MPFSRSFERTRIFRRISDRLVTFSKNADIEALYTNRLDEYRIRFRVLDNISRLLKSRRKPFQRELRYLYGSGVRPFLGEKSDVSIIDKFTYLYDLIFLYVNILLNLIKFEKNFYFYQKIL